MTHNCLNCDGTLQAEFKFCAQCGQRTHLHRLSLHEVLHEAIHYFTHADKGFFILVKALFTKSGTVANEYIAGKRKSYFPPLNFFLLVATIYVLLIGFTAQKSVGDVMKAHPELRYIPDAAKREQVRQIYERKDKAQMFMNKYSNIVAMTAVPLICFIYWLFYIRGKYNYTEHLVACFYMAGFTYLVYAVIAVPVSLLSGNKLRSGSVELAIAFMLFQMVYNAFFYYRFINNRSKAGAWKAVGVSLCAVLLWFSLSGFLVGLYIRTGF
ncbi:MAG TPA: DUF3667 domain-containing protein [Chitinophagaceae bacterium]|jgi:hypothetical protein|nr:DUF3667 domain-containing protein [Chitinophagaceae bacterium]